MAAPSKSVQRAPRPYQYGRADVHVDLHRRTDFRFFAIRHGRPNVPLYDVETATWTDETAVLAGTLTLRDPAFNLGEKVVLGEGDQVLSQVNTGGGWRNYWLMRVKDPDFEVRAAQRTVQLANDLELLSRSTDDFWYPRGKGAHKHGWLGHEIIRDVCKRWGVPLARCPVLKTRQGVSASFGRNRRPGDIIADVLKNERRATGRRFLIRWDFIPGRGLRQGLYIEPFRRSPHLLELGPTLLEAQFRSSLPKDPYPSTNSFASAVVMRGVRALDHGRDAKGHAKKGHEHLRVYVESKATRARYGYVRRVLWSPDARTAAGLTEEGRQWLAAIAKPSKTLTLTETGVPYLWRGDAIRLALGDEALRRQIVYVSSTSHTLVAPSDYQTVIEVTFDDPYVDKRALRILDKLRGTEAEAAQMAPKPKDKKGKQHSDALPPGAESPVDIYNREVPGGGGLNAGGPR